MTTRVRVAASETAAGTTLRPRFRLGTRGSTLAMMQSSTVADALRALGAEVELVTIRTAGDDRPPDTVWGEGAFVGALERALLDGTVDFAVHSAKDVPTDEPDGLTIVAYPRREDPRDALVGREQALSLETLPIGARVGTDSPRRSAFLRVARPDLQVHPLHGNVDTRLRRLDDGETDALVLAVAGLTRLGRADRIGQILPADAVPPAPGQGSLAVQCRTDDQRTREWLGRLDDAATRTAVEAERAFLRATGGGCRAPIGALGRVEGDILVLVGATAGIDAPATAPGETPVVAWGEIRGRAADRADLAAALAARLTTTLAGYRTATDSRTSGAGTRSALTRRRSPRVLVTRPARQSDGLLDALRTRGFETLVAPTIEILPVAPGGDLDRALTTSPLPDWIVVTSANAADAVLDAADRLGVRLQGPRWGAVGPATAEALARRGIADAFVPSRADASTLAAELPLTGGARVLLPRSDIADRSLVEALAARGARPEAAAAYRTIEGPASSRGDVRAAFAAGTIDAIVFTSGSTVRGLIALLGPAHGRQARDAVAVCIGDRTASAAEEAAFTHVVTAPATDPVAIAGRIADALGDGRQEVIQ